MDKVQKLNSNESVLVEEEVRTQDIGLAGLAARAT
jgi:hypothetical protein